jgi:hypothetical protein
MNPERLCSLDEIRIFGMASAEGPGVGTREVKWAEGSSHAKQGLKIATTMDNPKDQHIAIFDTVND